MPEHLNVWPAVAALMYALLGLLVFALAFVIVDRLTPYHLWKEIIDDQNVALAIIVGAVAIGIAIIVAASIH
jgi:putative membrane protein